MLTSGQMDSVDTPTFAVIAQVPYADKWPNGQCAYPNRFSDSPTPSGQMDGAH